MEPRPPQVIVKKASEEMFASPGAVRDRLKKSESQKSFMFIEMIMNWPNFDVWPYKLGTLALFSAAAGTGSYLNTVYRESYLLTRTLRISTYVGLSCMSGIFTGLFHVFGITLNVLEPKWNQCAVCLQLKAAAIQVGMGVVYPAILAPLMSYQVASSVKNTLLPKVYSKPRVAFDYSKSVFAKVKGPLLTIAVAQAILAMGVTYGEQWCYYKTVLPVLRGEALTIKKREF